MATPKWHAHLQPNDPPPKPGEQMRRYLLRRHRFHEEEAQKRLREALKQKDEHDG